MNNGNNDNGPYKGIFANGQQRKFYLIGRAFKIGNILGALILVIFIGKSLLGV